MKGFFKRAKMAAGAAKNILFGYQAIESSRYRNTRANVGILQSEEAELTAYDRIKLISFLLDFKRNDPIVSSISRMKRTDVVGCGLSAQPITSDRDYNDTVSKLWDDWCVDPEVTGRFDMVGVQRELIDGLMFFGDTGVLLSENGQLQLVEGSRIGPEGVKGYFTDAGINCGVNVDSLGKPVSYSVGTVVNGMVANARIIPAESFLLFYNSTRPSQLRGIPALAACANTIQDVAEYDMFEMLSAKTSATLSAVVTRQNSVQYELARRNANQDEVGRLETFEPGSFHYMEPGESVNTISSSGRPNVNGIEWQKYQIRKVGAAVGIPYEFLLSDIGGASFSASQGVVLLYSNTIDHEQRLLARLMSKIYNWKIRGWVASGRLKIPSTVPDPYKVRWQTPKLRWINRESQVAADMRYLQMGAMSLDDVTTQFGDTAEAVMRRKAQNIVMAKKIAEENGIDNYRSLFSQMETFANVNLVDVIESENGQSAAVEGGKND